jgi:prepilin-type processing-associated H-X9-DG protein
LPGSAIIDKYMNRKSTETYPLDGNSPYYDDHTKRRFQPGVPLPQHAVPTSSSRLTYYQHRWRCRTEPMELNPACADPTPVANRVVHQAARSKDLYGHNALFWDTMAWHDATADVASMFLALGGLHTPPAGRWRFGHRRRAVAGSDQAAAPLSRAGARSLCRSGGAYPKDSFLNPNDSIAWWSDKGLIRYGGYPPSAQTPTPGASCGNFAYGGPRWRHNSNTTCNVAFADGSVRGLQLGREIAVG